MKVTSNTVEVFVDGTFTKDFDKAAKKIGGRKSKKGNQSCVGFSTRKVDEWAFPITKTVEVKALVAAHG